MTITVFFFVFLIVASEFIKRTNINEVISALDLIF